MFSNVIFVENKTKCMKKIFVIALMFMINISFFNGQTDSDLLGWRALKSGAEIKVVIGNFSDVKKSTDWTQINYSDSEMLLVFLFQKDIYYCYDPEGRVVLVKGENNLIKPTIKGRPMQVTETVKIDLDRSLYPGNNVWVTDFNAARNTATVLLSDGTLKEIPNNVVQDFKEAYDILGNKITTWKKVE